MNSPVHAPAELFAQQPFDGCSASQTGTGNTWLHPENVSLDDDANYATVSCNGTKKLVCTDFGFDSFFSPSDGRTITGVRVRYTGFHNAFDITEPANYYAETRAINGNGEESSVFNKTEVNPFLPLSTEGERFHGNNFELWFDNSDWHGWLSNSTSAANVGCTLYLNYATGGLTTPTLSLDSVEMRILYTNSAGKAGWVDRKARSVHS